MADQEDGNGEATFPLSIQALMNGKADKFADYLAHPGPFKGPGKKECIKYQMLIPDPTLIGRRFDRFDRGTSKWGELVEP